MTLRRLSAVACSAALVVALCFAALHQHDLVRSPTSSGDAGCVYCSGGMVAAQAPVIVPASERVWCAEPQGGASAPSLRWLQPLAHSGNAPPA